MQGKFITFEGPEGSGKSTQVKLLAERLNEQGKQVVCTREPGGTAIGEAIRNMLQHDDVGEELDERAELLLFAASRAQLVRQNILPALEKGIWVVCDRFIDSTMAYQGYARGLSVDTLERINEFAICGRRPDLTLLLDIDVDVGFQRLDKRYTDSAESHDRFEREARDFHLRVCDGYYKLAAREPDRFRIVDGNRSIDEIASDVWLAVQGALS